MRMIDADALESHEQLEPMGNGQYEYVEVVYKDDIDDAPAIDAVSVVRCEDCIFYEKTSMDGTIANFSIQGFCHRYESIVYRNDFCSYGKRGEDEI